MRVMICVDMQNDFVTGALGSKDAAIAVPNVVSRLEEYADNNSKIFFTKDTHYDDFYFDTLEGKKLPVKHCIQNTEGWELIPEVDEYEGYTVYKLTFGYTQWAGMFKCCGVHDLESIEICGVCTDICVVSQALILRAEFPNVPIIVYANACAGTSPEAHEAALKVMESCQIDVIR